MTKKAPTTPLPPREFEARRLHNLVLLYEDAKDLRGRLRSGDAVAKAARQYLERFHGLRRRS
jgi:hypothetical protein